MTPAAYIDRRCNDTMCERKGHYVVQGRCSNCGWEGYVWITLGHDKVDRCIQAECPRCECRKIRPGEYVDA